jgi:hypothetical protein
MIAIFPRHKRVIDAVTHAASRGQVLRWRPRRRRRPAPPEAA